MEEKKGSEVPSNLLIGFVNAAKHPLRHSQPTIQLFLLCRLHSQRINISLACRMVFFFSSSGYQASSWEHYLNHNDRGWAVMKVLNYATLRIFPHEASKLPQLFPGGVLDIAIKYLPWILPNASHLCQRYSKAGSWYYYPLKSEEGARKRD